MMKKTGALLAMLLACAPAAQAQEKSAAPFEGYSKSTRAHVHFEVNPDATYVETVDYAIKVLDKNSIGAVNTQSVSFSNSLSDLEVISAYTLKANGKRIDVPKENFQVESNTGDKGASPLISDITTKTVVFPDVDVGDTINFSYKLIQKEALFPKQFSFEKSFSDAYVYEDSELSVTAPEALPIRVEARDVKGGEIARENGKRRWVWHYENHEIAKPEREAVSTFDFGPRVLVSTFKDYAELAAAYESRAKPAVTDQVKKLAEEVTKDAKGTHDIAAALYYWVAKHIHYAGNCIGIGSVVPHDVAHILDNKIGDCKDHTALLEALLAAKGIESTPVLVNSGNAYTIPDLPVVGVFNHVINYIPALKMYADSTSELTPFGMLPIDEEGKSVIHTMNFDGIRKTPPTDNSKHWGKMRTEITFNDDGSADGDLKTTMAGVFATGISRAFVALKIDARLRETVTKSFVSDSGFKGTAEFVRYDDPAVQSDPFSYEIKFHIDNAINVPGPAATYVYSLLKKQNVPISDFVGGVYLDKPRHNFPCIGGASTEEIIFHMPKSVKVLAVPKDVHLKWKYGSYDSTYKNKGGVVSSLRKIVDDSPGNVCTPEIDELERPFSTSVIKDLKSQIIYN